MRKFEIPATEFLPLRLVAEKLLAHQHVEKVEQYHALVNAAQAGAEVTTPDCVMTTETSNARGEWVLVPREIVDRFPEINPSNYDHGDACVLNAWGVELVRAVRDAAPPPAAARGDVRGLVAKWRERGEQATIQARNKDWSEWVRDRHHGAAGAFMSCVAELESALAAEGVTSLDRLGWVRRDAVARLRSDPDCTAALVEDHELPDSVPVYLAAEGVQAGEVEQRGLAVRSMREANGDFYVTYGPFKEPRSHGEAMTRIASALWQQPEARGVVDDAVAERSWPIIGKRYLVKLGGVLQHEVYVFDQGDCEPGGSAPPFWSRDGLDDCPEFDPHKDQWISLDEIDAALTGERNG
jgi:hypothetical protein